MDREGHGQEGAEATADRLGDVEAGAVTGTVTAEATAGDGQKTGEGTTATIVMGVTITVTMMTGRVYFWTHFFQKGGGGFCNNHLVGKRHKH